MFALECMTGQLAAALAAANTVTDHGIKYPLLKASRIHVDGNAAWIFATNMNQAIRSRIAAVGEGTVHLDTAALASKITALKQTAPVSISGDAKAVTITQGRTKWKLPIIINDAGFNFEASAGALDGDPVEVVAGQLQTALAGVRTAFSSDESRYYLSGACIELSASGFRVVATDGNILAAVQIPGKFPARETFLMPAQAVNATAKLFDADSKLKMVSTADAFTLDDGDTFFRSKNIEGVFPDWQRVLPKTTGSVEVDGAEFLAALVRVASIREDIGKATKFVPVEMTFSADEIAMSSKNHDGEEGTDFCACERPAGGDYHVSFSADTLADALRSFGPIDTLRIDYGGPVRKIGKDSALPPVIIRRALAAGDDFRLVNLLRESRGDI